MDLLSRIVAEFNELCGDMSWNNPENMKDQLVHIHEMVSQDKAYHAMKNSDAQNARIESERALQQVIFSIMADNMELFKRYQNDDSFRKALSDLVFKWTYNKQEGKPFNAQKITE